MVITILDDVLGAINLIPHINSLVNMYVYESVVVCNSQEEKTKNIQQ